jgi:CDP-diacylglycerol--serine O-phosphatidyltransferase
MRVRRRLSDFSVNRMVPNVLTVLAVCAGMTAIRFAVDGKLEAACYAIIIGGIFDGLDGRVARLLRSTSRFGAELDSLADFISFGVAPAVVLYLWTMSAFQSIGWAIVLIFAVCCALRLARFNTQLAAEPPPRAAGFFTGAPAPAGAGLLMLPMFISFEWGDWIRCALSERGMDHRRRAVDDQRADRVVEADPHHPISSCRPARHRPLAGLFTTAP